MKNTGYIIFAKGSQIEILTCIFHFSFFIFHLFVYAIIEINN